MSDRKPGWMDRREWQDNRDHGRLWCYRDQAWEPVEEFGLDRRALSGRAASCRRSLAARDSGESPGPASAG